MLFTQFMGNNWQFFMSTQTNEDKIRCLVFDRCNFDSVNSLFLNDHFCFDNLILCTIDLT